jgi:phosphoribosylformimino-5-aminoimidazole carboxamide ribotide isomerase
VRLSQGDYAKKKVYNENPVEVAKAFEDHGLTHLHLVDLDGAKGLHIVNYKILEKIATQTGLHIDFGGGIKSDKDVKIAFECGAQQITGGSIAVKDPELFELWLMTYGKNKIVLGADAKSGQIATHGWLETSELEVHEFIQSWLQKGVKNVICTDISKDGMLEGPSLELYKCLLEKSQSHGLELALIASGGVSSLDDLYRLREIGCSGAILGKAIYENRISLKELKNFMLEDS